MRLKKVVSITFEVLSIILLTILTQIGGVVYLLSLVWRKKWKTRFIGKPVILFLTLYLIFTFLIIPFTAPFFGREKVKNTERIKPTNFVTVLLNRNYVKPTINQLLANVDKVLAGQDNAINIRYLDANFPFYDGFPLLPHLSHNDGKKIDISLVYETPKSEITSKQKSWSGYGIFEEPTKKEHDQISFCKEKGYFQYDFPKYLTFGRINPELNFSKGGTKKLVKSFLSSSLVGKMFIEPHLKSRLGLNDSRIRYHGCKAVRHDDHIHVQVK
ncbi:hypothetical protein R9C00_08690 [Flammeovirgaceae bacterium SG7u.111]|nr:hypothetical protein [Flammeovirgaceae bacterium SG7u.132]WPO37524.1 hypothetical protein R9C00_08690 [Flammeovirgaceae bacterium SG7u.111]